MATSIVLSEVAGNILKRSLNAASTSGPNVKLLYGRKHGDEVRIVAVADCPSLGAEDVKRTITETDMLLAGGAALCGWAYLVKDRKCAPTTESDLQQFSQIQVHVCYTEPIILCYTSEGDGIQLIAQSILDEGLADIEINTGCDVALSDSILARAKCFIPLAFCVDTGDSWMMYLKAEVDRLCKDILSDRILFHLVDSQVLIGRNSCHGLPTDATLEYLTTCSVTEDDSGSIRKKHDKSLRCVNFEMYADLSGPCSLDTTPSCAPVINYTTGQNSSEGRVTPLLNQIRAQTDNMHTPKPTIPFETVKKVNLRLPVDVVTVLSPGDSVTDVAVSLSACMYHQIQAMCKCLLKTSKGGKFLVPEPYHYQPYSLPTLVSVVLPRGVPDDKLVDHRKHIHKCLCLPVDRPMFRRANKFRFPVDLSNQGYLLNVHEGVLPSKVSSGTQYLVQGSYTYHHYMQDRFDDNKWGCAYRSLQTLVSWFIWQGYTDRAIPGHKEIQQTLVNIGDKEPNFVGSRKWIGSMEVSFVLDTLLGVTCKILSVSTGAEMASKGRELAAHFSTQGTPVMIGGGVLAHTILGVDYDEVTGDIAFLILDPHYTGAEEVKVIHNKGWCGWKGPDFWDQTAHYNMCLPQRPNVV